MREPFYAGQVFDHEGVRYRIIKGNRCDGDLIIEFSCVGWCRPTIAHNQILTDFKYQVEENNYGNNGKVTRGRGGLYLMESIWRACQNGWRSEAAMTRRQREEKARRELEELEQLEMWDSRMGKNLHDFSQELPGQPGQPGQASQER